MRSSICLVFISYSASFINHYFFFTQRGLQMCFIFLSRAPHSFSRARLLGSSTMSFCQKEQKVKINLHFVLNWHTRLFVYFIFSEIKTNNFRVPRGYRKFIHYFIFLFLIFHLLAGWFLAGNLRLFFQCTDLTPGFPVMSGSGVATIKINSRKMQCSIYSFSCSFLECIFLAMAWPQKEKNPYFCDF